MASELALARLELVDQTTSVDLLATRIKLCLVPYFRTSTCVFFHCLAYMVHGAATLVSLFGIEECLQFCMNMYCLRA